MEDRLVGRRLAGESSLRHAALRAFAAGLVGALLSRVVPFPVPVGLAVAALALAVARPSRGWSLYLALAGAALAWTAVRAPMPARPEVFAEPSFRGVVMEEPPAGRPGRMVVALDRPEGGRVMVWLRDTLVRPRYGDELVVHAPARAFDHPRNPGLPDRNEQLARQGYVGRSNVSGRQLELTGRNRGSKPVRAVVLPARARLKEQVARLLPGDPGAILLALLAGDRRDVTRPTLTTMSDSGLLHVLAVSGLHVGIIAGLVWLLLALVGVRGWWRFALGTLAIVAYVVFVGARPPAVRAGIIAVTAALAWTGQRRFETTAALGLAGLAQLLVNPNAFFELGTRLSFAAVAAIFAVMNLVFARRQARRLPAFRAFSFPGKVAAALAASVAAFAATAPFLLHAFGRVQLLAIPMSPVAILLTTLIVPLGGLATLLSSMWLPLGMPFAETVRLLIGGLLRLAELTAGCEPTMLRYGGSGLWPAAAALVLFLLLHGRGRRARVAAAAVVLAGITVSVWAAALRPAAERAWFLDPKTGDAMVFEDAAGRVLVVDAGIDGPGVLRDFLLRRGVRRVSVAVITHPDRDHYGGLLDITGKVRIERLVIPTAHGPPDYRRLLERLVAEGTRLVFAGTGTGLEFGGFRFRFVWPDEPARRLYAAELLGANDVSLVALAERGGYRMLLTGDLDRPELIAGRDIRAHLLKSSHHGSRKGNAPEVIEEVGPELVVVMGRYPTPAGLEERLPAPDIGHINTRRDGGVSLDWSGPQGDLRPVVRDYRGRVLTVGP
ncbi:MAG TPA: DUF4131 domain-containing protein [candidate division WOR-3 bacterium]|uniref:DUF4131 domain-containing protein n=1 Tax=candidate division WOR-3 bacterium TaxID=2052148 RepID=A0A7V0XEX3_UNCW3|nr:DUF4131 domain-containing protein [candidate division WOR-3 bacterium]